MMASANGCRASVEVLVQKAKAVAVDHADSVSYCAALHFSSLYCYALYCSVLYFTVPCCTVLYCTALLCTALHCFVLHCTVLYCTVLYCTALPPLHMAKSRFMPIIAINDTDCTALVLRHLIDFTTSMLCSGRLGSSHASCCWWS